MTAEQFQPVGALVKVWGLPGSPGDSKCWVELRERRDRKKGYALHLYDKEDGKNLRSYPMHDRFVCGICWGGRYIDGVHNYYLAIVFPKTTLLLEPAFDDLASRNEHRSLGIEIALRLKQDQWWNINILANNLIPAGPGCLHIGRRYLALSRRDECEIPRHEASWMLKDVVCVTHDGDELTIVIKAEQEDMVGFNLAPQEIRVVLHESDPKNVNKVFNRRKSSRRKPAVTPKSPQPPLPERPQESRPKLYLRSHPAQTCPAPPQSLPELPPVDADRGATASSLDDLTVSPASPPPPVTSSLDNRGASPSHSDDTSASSVSHATPPDSISGDGESGESEEEVEESTHDGYKLYDENMSIYSNFDLKGYSYYTLGNMSHLSVVLESFNADRMLPAERCRLYVNVNQDEEECSSANQDEDEPIYHPLFSMARSLITHRRLGVPNMLGLSSNARSEFGLELIKCNRHDMRNDWKVLAHVIGVDDGTVDRIEILDCSNKLEYTCGELLMMFWEYYSQGQTSDWEMPLAECNRETLRDLFLRIDRYDLAHKLDKLRVVT